jgi:hypothetical protein
VYIAELRKALEAEQAPAVEPCKGHNCGSINPKLHSAECFDEHEALAGCQRPFGYFHFVFDSDNGDYWRETDDESEMPLFTHPAPQATGEQAPAVEPIGYVRHADKTFWPHPECAVYASVSPSLAPVYAHPAPPAEQAQAVEPVAWMVYVAEANNQYAVCDLDDQQLVDDCTNHNAEVTPLFTHPAPTPSIQESLKVRYKRGYAVALSDAEEAIDDECRERVVTASDCIEIIRNLGAETEATE